MIISTVCYIENNDRVLMLYRNKKKKDTNGGKWIGVGGKLETNESPNDCILREIYEETGLEVQNLKLRAIITFILPKWENELTFVYTASKFTGTLKECDEGELQWIPIKHILDLPLWEGDRYFLPLLFEHSDFFQMKLVYDDQDHLIEVRS